MVIFDGKFLVNNKFINVSGLLSDLMFLCTMLLLLICIQLLLCMQLIMDTIFSEQFTVIQLQNCYGVCSVVCIHVPYNAVKANVCSGMCNYTNCTFFLGDSTYVYVFFNKTLQVNGQICKIRILKYFGIFYCGITSCFWFKHAFTSIIILQYAQSVVDSLCSLKILLLGRVSKRSFMLLFSTVLPAHRAGTWMF